MAVVTGLTAERMLDIEASSVVGGEVRPDGNLYLETHGGTETNAGRVRGNDGVAPTGSIIMFAGISAPPGWVLCDGREVSRVTHDALFSITGIQYGGGNGITTFNVPNLKGSIPVGLDTTQSEFDIMGKTAGVKAHQLSEAEMPAHTHTQAAHTHTQAAHNHTQDAHTHTQAAHTHTGSTSSAGAHVHNMLYDSNRFASGTTASFTSGGALKTTNAIESSGAHTHTVTTTGTTAVNNNTTAVNNAATATNNNTTAVNNTTIATNNATTATNNNTTAINHTTGGSVAHTNLQPYVVLNYIIKT